MEDVCSLQVGAFRENVVPFYGEILISRLTCSRNLVKVTKKEIKSSQFLKPPDSWSEKLQKKLRLQNSRVKVLNTEYNIRQVSHIFDLH